MVTRDDAEPSKMTALMMSTLNWAYDQASAAIPGFGNAEDLAESHRASCDGDAEKAIDNLINWHTAYAFSAGFVANSGGLITLPIGVPANLASVLLIQLRMIAAIAHLRSYRINDERVRSFAFLCLTGSSAAAIVADFGVNLGTKLSMSMLTQISGAILTKINQAVGFRLVAKAGRTGLVNLTKFVPFIGGLVGGGFDAATTRLIGYVAKEIFVPRPNCPDIVMAGPEV